MINIFVVTVIVTVHVPLISCRSRDIIQDFCLPLLTSAPQEYSKSLRALLEFALLVLDSICISLPGEVGHKGGYGFSSFVG